MTPPRSDASPLTGSAFDGPVDIVGDVHGELEALEQLLQVLGYRGRGEHPAGRRLLFIGDLCDRGPDSPGVVRRVREMVEAGTAQCLLGNHELNVLRGARKQANGWFFERDHDREQGLFTESRPAADDAERESIQDFFLRLPLVLVRDDLRLVHACWSDTLIAELRAASPVANAVELYRLYAARAEESARASGLAAEAADLLRHYGDQLHDPDARPPLLQALAKLDVSYQMSNPVRVLTSGVERPAESPYFMAGKWRMVERADWWDEYASRVPVLFGHYWRWPNAEIGVRYGRGARNPFPGVAANEWTGPLRTAFCIDFSVGARYVERLSRPGERFASRLGAVRWPERELLFETGEGADLVAPPPAGEPG